MSTFNLSQTDMIVKLCHNKADFLTLSGMSVVFDKMIYSKLTRLLMITSGI